MNGVLSGYNGTVFAYGQTGCGKSFTMEGIPDPPIHRGITPRSFEHIFDEVATQDTKRFLIRASYLEIYNENVRDLLSKTVNTALDLREDPDRGVYVAGLGTHEAKSSTDLIKLMAKGTQNRSVGATAMNADSSRSHSIFTVWVEMCETRDDGSDHIMAGKLNLVDLAGSERQSKTQAEGARLKEATKINLSLSALGNVISALVDGKAKHIPYRDSKLTRLLQDSLGGNTKTLMIAALSPADNNYDETLSTLRYANRAKNIKNKAVINEDPKDALLREYQEQITKLKAMLSGKMDIGGLDLSGSPKKPEPRMSAIVDGAVMQQAERDIAREREIRAVLEEEKQREIEEIEKRLEADYDSKLSKLEAQFNKAGVDHDQLEKQFAELTEDLEAKKAVVAEGAMVTEEEVTERVIEAAEAAGEDPKAAVAAIGAPTVEAAAQAIAAETGAGVVAVPEPAGAPTTAVAPLAPAPAGGTKGAKSDAAAAVPPPPMAGQQPPQKPKPVGRAATVIGEDGMPVIALQLDDGQFIKATLGDDGQLRPVTDAKNAPIPIVSPGGGGQEQVQEVMPPRRESQAQSVMRFVPTTVVGDDGQPAAALVGPDGNAVKAVINERGELEPHVDASGNYTYFGTEAKEVFSAEEPITMVNAEGDMVIAVRDGPDTVLAQVAPDGSIKPARDAAGNTQAVGGVDGSTLHTEPIIEKLHVHTPVVVTGKDGKPTIGVLDNEGKVLHAQVQPDGSLAPRTDRKGKTKRISGPDKQPARRIPAVNAPVIAIGPDGKPTVAVVGPDGELCDVMLDGEKQLQMKVSRDQQPVKLLGPDGKPAREVVSGAIIATGEKVKVQAAVAAVDDKGKAVAAIEGPDGIPVAAEIGKDGTLQPVRDEAGSMQPIAGPTNGAPERVQVPEMPVPIIDREGQPSVGILHDDGVISRPTIGADGMLTAATDGDGFPIEIDGAKIIKASTSVVSQAMPKLVAVIGSDGKPVPAIIGTNGVPVKAQVAEDGRVEAVRDASGELVVVQGPSGKQAEKVVAPDAPRMVKVEDSDEPVVAVKQADGQLVRAEVDAEGNLKPVLGPTGEAEVVGTEEDVIATNKVAEVAVKEPEMVLVVNEGGQAVPAVLDADGSHVKVGLNKFGQLEAVRDAAGKKIKLAAQGGAVTTLKTIVEEHDVEISPVGTPRHSLNSSPERDADLAKQLRAKLEALQAQTVGAESSAVDEAEKVKLKRELAKKKTKAERAEAKRLERLRRAAENAEDDGKLEEVYNSLTDEIKDVRKKLTSCREKLSAARQENTDLSEEFERERAYMLEDVRKLNKDIKFQQAYIQMVIPLIRRDCNYYNLDKIKAGAFWDDERQDWQMPKITTGGSAGAGRRGSGGANMSSINQQGGRPAPNRAAEPDPYRDRLANSQESTYFQSKRAQAMLSSLEGRAGELRAQQAERVARFDRLGPVQSARSHEIMRQKPTDSLTRSPRNRIRGLPGGSIQPGAMQAHRSPKGGRRKKPTAEEWLRPR